MSNEKDMDAPVTHREMNDALEVWAGAIIAKLTKQVVESEQRLTAQLASWSSSNRDDFTRAIRTVDDKYQEIPIRVTRLENKVFAPRKRRRATAARRKRS